MKKYIPFWLFILVLMGIIFVFSLGSCMTTKKATDYLKDKGELAEICADEYPVKTEFVKGDSTVIFDTLYVGNDIVFDTTILTVKDTVYKTVTKTLPEKIITKTVRVTDTVKVENTARVTDIQNKLAVCNNDKEQLAASVKKWKGKSKTYFWIIVVLTAFILRKPLLSLVKKFIKF